MVGLKKGAAPIWPQPLLMIDKDKSLICAIEEPSVGIGATKLVAGSDS